jgi:hypothetical protein
VYKKLALQSRQRLVLKTSQFLFYFLLYVYAKMARLKYLYLGLLLKDPVCVNFCLITLIFLKNGGLNGVTIKGASGNFFSQFYCFLTVALNQDPPILDKIR